MLKSVIMVILCMIFMHIVADYNLQGWLASAKQKSWWEENSPGKLYEYDYIVALFIHSFQWTFLVMLPLVFYGVPFNINFLVQFCLHAIIHMGIDHMKANEKIINLWIDQFAHLAQIGIMILFLI